MPKQLGSFDSAELILLDGYSHVADSWGMKSTAFFCAMGPWVTKCLTFFSESVSLKSRSGLAFFAEWKRETARLLLLVLQCRIHVHLYQLILQRNCCGSTVESRTQSGNSVGEYSDHRNCVWPKKVEHPHNFGAFASTMAQH